MKICITVANLCSVIDIGIHMPGSKLTKVHAHYIACVLCSVVVMTETIGLYGTLHQQVS